MTYGEDSAAVDVLRDLRSLDPQSQSNKLARRVRLQARSLVSRVVVLYRVLKNPQTPWPAKIIAGFGVGYVFSPIQLIPNFIPVVGQLDDLMVLFCCERLLRRMVPKEIFEAGASHSPT